MPQGPTVIPGVYGWGEDVGNALAQIGQALAAPMIAEQLKIRQALETMQDPEYAHGIATRLDTAHAKTEAADLARQEARDRGASQEEINKLADPVGIDILNSYKAEMLAVGLDPTNPKHQQMARPILEAARSALPLDERAKIRAGLLPGVLNKAVRTQAQAVSNVQAATQLEGLQLQLANEMFPGQAITAKEQALIDQKRVELVHQAITDYEPLWRKDPVLRAMMAEVGPEAFAEAVLTYLRMTPKQVGAQTLDDDLKLQAAQQARDIRFAEGLEKAIYEDNLSGERLKLRLTGLLNDYQSYDGLGRHGMQAPLFPLEPTLFEHPKLLGLLGTDVRMRVRTGFPPPGNAKDGVPIASREYRGWSSTIAQIAQQEGPEAAAEDLRNSVMWNRMTPAQQAYAYEAWLLANIVIPIDVGDFDSSKYSMSQAEIDAMVQKSSWTEEEVNTPLIEGGRTALGAGLSQVGPFVRRLFPRTSAIGQLLGSGNE